MKDAIPNNIMLYRLQFVGLLGFQFWVSNSDCSGGGCYLGTIRCVLTGEEMGSPIQLRPSSTTSAYLCAAVLSSRSLTWVGAVAGSGERVGGEVGSSGLG